MLSDISEDNGDSCNKGSCIELQLEQLILEAPFFELHKNPKAMEYNY